MLKPIDEPGIPYHVMELLLVHRRVPLLEPMDGLWLAKSTLSPEARAANFTGQYTTDLAGADPAVGVAGSVDA